MIPNAICATNHRIVMRSFGRCRHRHMARVVRVIMLPGYLSAASSLRPHYCILLSVNIRYYRPVCIHLTSRASREKKKSSSRAILIFLATGGRTKERSAKSVSLMCCPRRGLDSHRNKGKSPLFLSALTPLDDVRRRRHVHGHCM